MATELWKENELIVVLNLYWKTPYNNISGSSNTEIKRIAGVIGRTPGAIAYKLMNLTSLDPERQGKGNKGKSGAGKLDRVVWDKYLNRWEELAFDSAQILRGFGVVDEYPAFEGEEKFGVGEDLMRLTKVRRNHFDFKQRVLASYNEACCITGLDIPTLLQACHIIPWAENKSEALNPRNGLCMNGVHHRAFDEGLFTITHDLRIAVSKKVKRGASNEAIQKFFMEYEGAPMRLPDRFAPAPDFLQWHQVNIFQK